MILAGVDGCRGGWVCVSLDLTTGALCSEIFSSIFQLLRRFPRLAVIAISIPIGRTEAGPRTCDTAARRSVPVSLAAVDDINDAFAVLWTAWRIHAGRARVIPDPPEKDARGIDMAIWF